MPFCFTGGVCNNEENASTCTGEEHGAIVTTCPTANLVGCCSSPTSGAAACTYTSAAVSAGTLESRCESESGVWMGTGLDVCALPTGTFSSEVGLVPALCVAQYWYPDAYLVGIEFGLASDLLPDGTDASWYYSFSSPSAPCNIAGGSGNEKIEISVNSTAITSSLGYAGIAAQGSTCGTYPHLTGEVDSTTVVPAAVALIMPMVAAGSTVTWFASDPIEAATDVAYVDGSAQVWSVEGYWTVAGGDFYAASETFDANGANPTVASLGPCTTSPVMCP